MMKLRFTIKTLLALTFLTAFVTIAVIRIVDSAYVIDLTGARSSICERHSLTMIKTLVGMSHGMPMLNSEVDPEDDARRLLFPHADEIYQTGYCCGTQQKKARIYVCSDWSKAREVWLKTVGSQ